MATFYFHYYTRDERRLDDIGCSFETLELAYLDAYRSMVEIGAELLKQGINPASHRIDIADGGGSVLMELPFGDIFSQLRREPEIASKSVRRRLEDARRLRQEIDGVCANARVSVASAREMVRRARELSLMSHATCAAFASATSFRGSRKREPFAADRQRLLTKS